MFLNLGNADAIWRCDSINEANQHNLHFLINFLL